MYTTPLLGGPLPPKLVWLSPGKGAVVIVITVSSIHLFCTHCFRWTRPNYSIYLCDQSVWISCWPHPASVITLLCVLSLSVPWKRVKSSSPWEDDPLAFGLAIDSIWIRKELKEDRSWSDVPERCSPPRGPSNPVASPSTFNGFFDCSGSKI